MFNKIIVNLPFNIKILIWKNNKNGNYLNIFLFNKNKKINLYVNIEKNKFKIDKNTNSFFLECKHLNEKNNKFVKFIENLIKSWDIYFFNKIKFKGKGFRMRFLKKNKFVKFFFGRSHKTFMFFKKIIMKKINKYKFILKHINKKVLIDNANKVTKIKPLNFYTLRGLRKTKQIVYKRKGKKGTYI